MRALRRNRPTIGVLAGWLTFPGTIHSFLNIVYQGIISAAEKRDCNLLIGCGLGSPFTNSEHPAMPTASIDGIDFVPVGPWNTDGLLVLGPLFSESLDSYFQGLVDSGFPVVFGGDHETGPAVVVDNEKGIYQAIDHLINHGHSRIAFVSGNFGKHGDCALRLKGYQAGLQKHGLAYDPDLVIQGEHSAPYSRQAIKTLIGRKKPFSAVITSNDDSAMGVMQGLKEAGYAIPQDVALIGFDDRMEARTSIPLLTSVHFPMFEMGYRSLELLLEIINNNAPANTLINIPTHLVIRESCGCLPGETITRKGYQQKNGGPGRDLAAGPSISPTPGYSPHFFHNNWNDIHPTITREMTEVVYIEMQRLDRTEVHTLCKRLLDAYIRSLEYGDAAEFHHAVQQILEYVVSVGDDLYSWQGAISVLREWTPALRKNLPHTLQGSQAEDLLHQARVAINEMFRGVYSRQVVNETNISTQINQMTSRFFAVHSDEEIFKVLAEDLPLLGIEQASVAIYHKEGEDPYAKSELKIPAPQDGAPVFFRTRDFPPTGLLNDQKAWRLAVVPIFGPDGVIGQAAFEGDNMSFFGTIVRQLAAALRSTRLFHEADEARQMAEEANILKSRFLSIVSHELRTPLNLIIGLSNMMLQDSEIKTENELECNVNRKDLERIYIGAQHLESLIRDVLDLSRSDVGQLKLVYEVFDLLEVLKPIHEIGQQLAQDKALTWNAVIPSGPLYVHGDRVRLRQVILNLINNAIKFTIKGSVTLEAGEEKGIVTIRVRDTGLGIPPEEQATIFNAFQQSTRTSSRGFGGLGLGLSICKGLVEMHGGSIGVQSNGDDDSGSTFYFSLPGIAQDLQPIGSGILGKSADTICLLVNNLAEGQRVKQHLETKDYLVEVQQIDESGEWMNLITIQPPSKIILDLGLTSQRGWEIVKALKENPATREISILFYNLESEQDTGSLLDMNFLKKPVQMNDLANAIIQHPAFPAAHHQGLARTILIVDDDEETLKLHTRMVETLVCESNILLARNGVEALEIIQTKKPALVLLDLMMSGMDGFAVLERMREQESSRSTPVIVLSSQTLSEEDMDRLNNGVVSVLRKGVFSVKETLNHIEAALSHKRKSASEVRRIILKAMAFIHQNYSETITRSDIASFVSLSERHLTRCFSQEIGLSPMAYLNRYRVHQAKVLLDANQKGITEIALEVGFSNSGYFTRVFREEVGLSPKEYAAK